MVCELYAIVMLHDTFSESINVPCACLISEAELVRMEDAVGSSWSL